MNFRLKTGFAVALGAVILVTIGASAYLSTERLLEANAWVAASQQRLADLEHIVGLLKDAEAGQRGFLLTGQESYLAPYSRMLAHFHQNLAALSVGIEDDAEQKQSLGKIQKLAETRLAQFNEAIELRRQSALPAARAAALIERGQQTMDQLQEVVTQIRLAEQRVLEQRSEAARVFAARALRVVGLWIPASLLLLVLAAMAVVRVTALNRPALRGASPKKRAAFFLLRYAAALLVVLIATLLRLKLSEAFGPLPTYITLYPAVLLVAALGGGGPGLFATAMAIAAADYWFLPPDGFGIQTPHDLLALGIFASSNIFLCLLAERLRQASWTEAHHQAQQEELDLLKMGNLVGLDTQSRITHWSEGCHRLYGFSSEEAIGRNLDELLQTRFLEPSEARDPALNQRGYWEGEAVRQAKNGAARNVALLMALRRDERGRPTAMLEVSTDITEQKRAEEAQQQQSDELSRQNEELTQQAEELTQQTEELTQQAEELSSQNEELQSQSEEIQLLNVELARRENLLQKLLDSARLASTERKVMQDICQAALEMFGPAAAAVIVHEKAGPHLHVRAHAGLANGEALPESRPSRCTFAELVIQEDRTACLDDTGKRPDLTICNPEQGPPFQSVLAAPMRADGEPFGTVAVYAYVKQQWTAEQFRLAEWLAGQCGGILETLRLQERVQRLYEEQQTIFHAVPAMIWYKDTKNNILRVNRAAALALGKPAVEIEGHSCHQLFPDEAERYYQDDLEVIRSAQPKLAIIEPLTLPTGQKRWVQTDKIPYRNTAGTVSGVLLFSIDITERKQFEEELQRAKAAAEAANVAKSQFLANMSHELRTPMNTILGMTELALGEQLSVRVRDYLQTARQSADGLLELLNEILDLSRVEAGKFDLESTLFDVHKAVDQVIKTVGLRAEEKGLELTCDLDGIPAQLVGDPLRLRQILVNLVGNAIKFTGEGEVAVRAHVVSSEAHEVVLQFEVADTGIGIPADDQRRIFAPFTQEDASTTRLYGGTGLGLTIAAKLVELMGGRIWIESELGKGSVFHFTVRMGLPEAGAEQLNFGLVTRDALRGLPVLVVAQNLTNRRVIMETFKRWAMKPETAQDVPRAIEKVLQAARQGQPYRFVLADALLPGTDGFTLARAIQAEPPLTTAVILMMSESERRKFAERCAELGAFCLEKPISQSHLFDLVVKVLGIEQRNVHDDREICPTLAKEPLRPLRVLLVEDTASNQKLVTCALENRGHCLVVAENGHKALEIVQREEFDLILMDVQMPVMDGMTATRAIRAMQPPISQLPIIAMTAHALTGDAERCLEAGMDGYLGKPVRIDELIGLVERFGEKAKAREPAVATSAAVAAPSQTLFDLDTAMKHCLGRYELFQDTVECFFQSADRLSEEMQEGIARGNLERIGEAAHRLVGVLVVGAQPVVEAARRVQQLALAGDQAGVIAAVDDLLRQVDGLKDALSPYRPTNDPN